MVYSVTLTFVFKVKDFLLCICYRKIAQTSDVKVSFASIRMAPAVDLLLLQTIGGVCYDSSYRRYC